MNDAWLSERIRAMHERSRNSYGARRIHVDLRDEGVRVGRKRVERLMRAAGLSGYVKRRKGKTTIRVEGVRPAEDLVDRNFVAAAPNQLWMSDIKAIPTWEGKLYLASVLDCFSRKVVGWSMRDDMPAELVVDAGNGPRTPQADGEADPPLRPGLPVRRADLRERRHSRLGYRSPDQYERDHDSEDKNRIDISYDQERKAA